MADYAIGDVHACLDPLRMLLERLQFDPARDRLWFTGDLVGRGPQAAETLRFIRDLGAAAESVLGNHDIHCLAVAAGHGRLRRNDRLEPLLEAPDAADLLHWLRQRPLLIEPAGGLTLVHAGIPPQWDLATARRCAREAETRLRSEASDALFAHLYGNQPASWSAALHGWPRLRFIINALTRMRFCHADGRLDFSDNGPPEEAPDGLYPWYETPGRRLRPRETTVISGHWSRLGCRQGPGYISLDTGCLWGGRLTAMRLDTMPPAFTQLDCPVGLSPT
ncbi:symmetrical bis(5'-nucleosyl)-tetraphosphatase [Spiribacter onubensis]|uniref:bis(5'-nucleosyl)-tetraphosphatase (symmetrical) n=1 Tax=Spiribacter onubensis TaxID=3122420 RepID=A0ABV3S7H0_9GAMM